jgi:hypothetical protein
VDVRQWIRVVAIDDVIKQVCHVLTKLTSSCGISVRLLPLRSSSSSCVSVLRRTIPGAINLAP